MTIPESPFGQEGPTVTRVGLGGEGVLRTYSHGGEAWDVIAEAVKQGLTYFDSAPAYAGSQAYLGAYWRERPADRARVFQCSKSAQRSHDGAWADLEHSLDTMSVGHLDLWQIHDLRSMAEFRQISGPNGALKAFERAREQGLVRRIGVTGHQDPDLLTLAVREWPVDAVLMPVNPIEASLGGFLTETLAAARERKLAVVGMKVLGGGHYIAPAAGVMAETLIRFALAQDVTVVVVGCGSPWEVQTLASASQMPPMEAGEQDALVDLYKPHARRLAYYRGW